MKTLKIVFTKSKKNFPVLSWLIRLWTWKPYSHVALEVSMSFLELPMYFQSNEGKVNYEYGKHFDKEHIIVKSYELEVPEEIYNNMKIERMKAAGENYGLWQNVGIAIVDVAKLLKMHIKNPWSKGRNCSEIVYVKILKPLFPDLNYDPNTIKPHQVERILIEKGYIDAND